MFVGRQPGAVSYRPSLARRPLRDRNLRARNAVSNVVSTPSTCAAVGRATPARVVAISDG